MIDYKTAQLIHVLAASVWIGGHIIILLGYVPRMLRTGSFSELDSFEKVYEKIGMPSLLIAVVTGVYMALALGWPRGPIGWWSPITLKLVLLAATVLLAVDARMRIIRRYRQTGEINLVDMALHITLVTLIAVLFAVAGWMIRY